MSGGQEIEKAAARISREQHSRGGELAPGNNLPGQEKQSEPGGHPPPGSERFTLAVLQLLSRHDNGDTTCEQYRCVKPKYGGQRRTLPVRAKTFSNNVRTRQRHEKHYNGCET